MKQDPQNGHLHPITQVINDVVRIFHELGFDVAEGTEIETEYYNFDALNVPKDHPARDMQDTFWLKGVEQTVLRTHTSPVQVHYMEKNKPPFRIVVPGKVFRHEATDATHEVQFYQVEGLVVGEDVTLAHLKGTLELFFKKLFGGKTAIRFRPSFSRSWNPVLRLTCPVLSAAAKDVRFAKKPGSLKSWAPAWCTLMF